MDFRNGLVVTCLIFVQLPIKYLDSAHDKAVGLVEDIHALIYAPCPDNELSNKGQRTLMDPSSSKPTTVSPPSSVKMEQANPDEELSSSPSSLLTAEDSFLCSTDTDAHETESVSSKSPGLSLLKHTRLPRFLIQLFIIVMYLSY